MVHLGKEKRDLLVVDLPFGIHFDDAAEYCHRSYHFRPIAVSNGEVLRAEDTLTMNDGM